MKKPPVKRHSKKTQTYPLRALPIPDTTNETSKKQETNTASTSLRPSLAPEEASVQASVSTPREIIDKYIDNRGQLLPIPDTTNETSKSPETNTASTSLLPSLAPEEVSVQASVSTPHEIIDKYVDNQGQLQRLSGNLPETSNITTISAHSTMKTIAESSNKLSESVTSPNALTENFEQSSGISETLKEIVKEIFDKSAILLSHEEHIETSRKASNKSNPTDIAETTALHANDTTPFADFSPRISSDSTHTFLGALIKDIKQAQNSQTVVLPSDVNILKLKEKYLLQTSSGSNSLKASKTSLKSRTPGVLSSLLRIPKQTPAIISTSNASFQGPFENSFELERNPSPSGIATKSYLESQKFFGSLAPRGSLASTSAERPPSMPTSERERITHVIDNDSENKFFDMFRSDIRPTLMPATISENDIISRKVTPISQRPRASEYSAVSSARRFSNPFMTPHKISRPIMHRPTSASQTLNDFSDRPSRGTALHTHFARIQSKSEEDVEKVLPWCSNCSKCCKNFSLFDPVCNIDWCFPYVQIFWVITLILGFLVIWVSMIAIWGEPGLPGGEIFQFYTLAVSAYVTGWIFACVNIPPSIGMFAAGILFGNLGWFHTRSKIASATRSIVVTFILLRAGLNTEASIFKTRGGLVTRMAFIPGLLEMLVAAMLALFYLEFTWDWALLFGCAVAPISPLAIIYSLVRLREEGYGEDKGITSVLLMMYALDNVTLVTLFGIFFTITFDVKFEDKTAIYLLVLQTFGSVFGGIGVGILIGTLITFFPHRYDPYCGVWRTILLCCSGLGTVLFSHSIVWDGAGYLCTIVMAFTANAGWKALGSSSYNNPVNMVFAMAWHILQPIALGLIGAEVKMSRMDADNVYSALFIIPSCMMTRFTVAFLMTGRAGFNCKERLFMSLLSVTKGTPQAALAPMTLDLARNRTQKHFARHLLNVCVLEVLFTLPLGPLIAAFTGQKLLAKQEMSEESQSVVRDEDISLIRRHRYRSVVGKIHTNNELFMLYRGGDNSSDNSL